MKLEGDCYLFVSQRFSNGTEANAVYKYSASEIESAYYSTLFNATADINMSECVCSILNKSGVSIKRDIWVRTEIPAKQTEPIVDVEQTTTENQ